MSPRRLRLPSSLLLRIYLVGIAQFVLIVTVVFSTRDLIAEPPTHRGPGQFMPYFIHQWAPLLEQPGALQQSLDQVKQYFDEQVTIRTLDGQVVASTASPPFEQVAPENLERIFQERAQREREPRDRELPRELPRAKEGRPSIILPLPLEGPPVAYAVIRHATPLGPPPINFAVLISLVLACTAVTSVIFARTLAVPLQHLAQVTRAFGTGNLGARTGVRRRDELGQVAEAFDEMAERITHLLRSQKELIANVSHELRTPLARIRVALDLAADGDEALARESLADITTDLTELERLVEDVLTAARLDLATGQTPGATPPLRKEHVEAQSLLDKASARFRTARPGHTLEVNTEGALPALDADPMLLRRALDNLLDNAGKYSEPGTRVRLSARPTAAGLQVEIQDEGIGIDPNDLPHLFTPFFRSDRSRARTTGGVGLGLALARRIVTAHGGTLTLESQPGSGTLARIVLPAGQQAASPGQSPRHLS